MKARVVSIHYTVRNPEGEVLDSSSGGEPLTYLEGQQQIISGLENQVKALIVGEKKRLLVPSSDAYGSYDQSLVVEVPKSRLPKANELQIGDSFEATASDDGEPIVFYVSNIGAENVTLDGNHPLAGQDLDFEVEVVEMREATPEELSHGHAHGRGGHLH